MISRVCINALSQIKKRLDMLEVYPIVRQIFLDERLVSGLRNLQLLALWYSMKYYFICIYDVFLLD